MSRASSNYVSPNLRPTTPWGQQTSTGVFRPPPPAFSLNSRDSLGSLSKDSPANERIQGSITACPKNGLNRSHSIDCSNGRASNGVTPDEGIRSKPSPPLQPGAAPFYPGQYSITRESFRHASLGNGKTGHSNGHTEDLPQPGTYSVESIMRAVTYAVHTETDMFAAQKESNRALECELHRLQEQQPALARKMEQLHDAIACLKEVRREQEELLRELSIPIPGE